MDGLSQVWHRRKNVQASTNKSQEKLENMMVWVAFFRANIEIFIEDYFGFKLKTFQKIVLHLMDQYPLFMLVASRGLGKSFLSGLYSCARCVLYPNTRVVIVAGSKIQASLIITQTINTEIRKLCQQYDNDNLFREIKKINTGIDDFSILFHNGSRIDVIAGTDRARGMRANLIIYDEFRLIPDDVINRVIKPFLNYVRMAGFREKPEYKCRLKDFEEENKEIFISSAYFKAHPMFDRFMDFVKRMYDQDMSGDVFVAGLSYKTSLRENMLTEKRIESIRNEATFTEIDWHMEFENLFYGLSENAFFAYDDIKKNRNLQKPTYSVELLDKIGATRKGKTKKGKNEIRIMGYDVALLGDRNKKDDNDNSALTYLRVLPEGSSFRRQLVDIKTFSGLTSTEQAKLMKRYFYEHEIDYIALDVRGNSISVYDQLIKVTYDEELDKEYPAWSAYNDEEFKKRAPKDAVPVIFAYNGTSERNHNMANWLRDTLQRGRMELLTPSNQAIDFLNAHYGYDTKDVMVKQEMLSPFVETEMLVNEMLNLEYELRSGFIRLFEKSHRRKDRYVSFGMANYLSRVLEQQYYRKGKKSEMKDFCKVFGGKRR